MVSTSFDAFEKRAHYLLQLRLLSLLIFRCLGCLPIELLRCEFEVEKSFLEARHGGSDVVHAIRMWEFEVQVDLRM